MTDKRCAAKDGCDERVWYVVILTPRASAPQPAPACNKHLKPFIDAGIKDAAIAYVQVIPA